MPVYVMSSRKPFLSVYGHVTVDQIISIKEFPDINESVDVLFKNTTLGGTGTNIAVTASSLGVPTALCSFVGEDFPTNYENFIKDSGVIMDDFKKVSDCETSQAIVLNNSKHQQKVIFYQGPQGCASKFGKSVQDSATKSSYVHFCTGEPKYYIDIMKDLDSNDLKIAIDPAQEIYKMWDSDSISRALDYSDYLFCNEYESKVIEKYLGISDVMLIDKPLVVRTEGEKGSVAKINGSIVKIPAIKGNDIKDATGAGDAYRAGYYAGLYNKYSVHDSLILAASVSSFVIENVGALTNIPSWDQVLERARDYL